MALKRSKSVRNPSARSADQPATRKMLVLVRREILQKVQAGFDTVESKFAGVDGKFAKVDARFAGVDARFSAIESSLNELKASSSRMEFLLEEQNANNRIVLEGLQSLWQRQDRLEAQLNSRPNSV